MFKIETMKQTEGGVGGGRDLTKKNFQNFPKLSAKIVCFLVLISPDKFLHSLIIFILSFFKQKFKCCSITVKKLCLQLDVNIKRYLIVLNRIC